MTKLHTTLLLLLLCMSANLFAAHITDKLVAGLYEEPKAEGKPIRLLPTGTPLEVAGREGDFIKVRLADETVGWVEAAYVSDAKPARAMLLEAQAQITEMKKQLERLKSETSDLKVEPLECEVAEVPEPAPVASCPEPSAASASMEPGNGARVQQLQLTLADMRERIQRASEALGAVPVAAVAEVAAVLPSEGQINLATIWLWIGLAVTLIAGFVAGVAFIDYRHRKRHGGFRI